MTASADDADVQPSALVTMNVKVPATSPETVVVAPFPLLLIAPGLRTRVHVPGVGNPLRATLPVPTVHVRFVMVPIAGAEGVAFTVNIKVPIAAEQGEPKGLFVVIVMITALPPSAAVGV
jgi:hypothetical protein